tara:strand:+ start:1017 stop:1478 length:462 start_codon:yes stop_codon:yes gene_type:complete
MNWDKINYGGQPTKNISIKRAIFIGRFQPYHYGHIELIEQKIKENVPILIMIRDIEPDVNNPFTAKQSKKIILKYHKNKKHNVKVIIIPDIESVNYGRGVGYEINQYTPNDKISNISATQIRESIRQRNDDWKNDVPKILSKDIFNNIINYGK